MSEITLKVIIKALDDKKGEDIVIIDVSERSPFANYYVLCSANNQRKLQALKEAVIESLEKIGHPIHHSEGKATSEWLLVDAYDVIVHIFAPMERERLQLDLLFEGLPRIEAAHYLSESKK